MGRRKKSEMESAMGTEANASTVDKAEGGKEKKSKPRIATAHDRVGEPVNMEKCPECAEHPDCFAWIRGKCTALKVCGGDECAFYKPTEVALAECRAAYKKLREDGKVELIYKYVKAFKALGVFDEEIADAGLEGESFETFREENYQQVLEMMASGDAATTEEGEDGEENSELASGV